MKGLRKEELFGSLIKENVSKNHIIGSFSGIFSSIKSGLIGFSIVFLLIVFTKLLSISTDSSKLFSLGINDLVLSLWGFIIMSFIVFASKNKRLK